MDATTSRGMAQRDEPRSQPVVRRVALRAVEQWPLILVIFAGVSTAFFRLDAKGLWGDEIWTVWWSFPEPFMRLRAPADFPLTWILVRLATTFGETEFWARLPSALLGAGTVVVLFLLGRNLFGQRTGLVAALLLAVTPYHVWMAQDARPYGPLAFFSILSLYFFCGILQGRLTVAGWMAFTGATILNLFNQFFALLPLAAEMVAGTLQVILSTCFNGRPPDAVRTARAQSLLRLAAILSGGLIAVLAACPLLLGLFSFVLRPGGPGKGGALVSQDPGALLVYLFTTLGAGEGWRMWAMVCLLIVGLGAGLYHRQLFATGVLVAWLALPVMALSLIPTYHFFDARYVSFVQPVYILLVGHGLVRIAAAIERLTQLQSFIPSPTMRWLIRSSFASLPVVIVLAMLFVPTWRGYWVEKVNDWSAVCSYLRREAQPGDIITGDGYFQGIMLWCLEGTCGNPLILPLGQLTLEELTDTGQSIWYINVTKSGPHMSFLKANYEAIPREAWAKADLNANPSVGYGLRVPTGEHSVELFRYQPRQLPQRVCFEGKPDSSAPSNYVQVPPRGHVYVKMGLQATDPRVLRVNYWDIPGRELELLVNGVPLARIKTEASEGNWLTFEAPLPENVGDTILLELANPGSETSAFSRVEVVYAGEAGEP